MRFCSGLRNRVAIGGRALSPLESCQSMNAQTLNQSASPFNRPPGGRRALKPDGSFSQSQSKDALCRNGDKPRVTYPVGRKKKVALPRCLPAITDAKRTAAQISYLRGNLAQCVKADRRRVRASARRNHASSAPAAVRDGSKYALPGKHLSLSPNSPNVRRR